MTSINYRTGPFGIPQGAEAERKGALNIALKDVQTALQWVQANIGAFGGDKDKVRYELSVPGPTADR